jgi:hypothetical protein
MNIQDICNKVCGSIKEGWKIKIHLENGAGWVELVDPRGCVPEFDSTDFTIEEQVLHLLNASHELPEK